MLQKFRRICEEITFKVPGSEIYILHYAFCGVHLFCYLYSSLLNNMGLNYAGPLT